MSELEFVCLKSDLSGYHFCMWLQHTNNENALQLISEFCESGSDDLTLDLDEKISEEEAVTLNEYGSIDDVVYHGICRGQLILPMGKTLEEINEDGNGLMYDNIESLFL